MFIFTALWYGRTRIGDPSCTRDVSRTIPTLFVGVVCGAVSKLGSFQHTYSTSKPGHVRHRPLHFAQPPRSLLCLGHASLLSTAPSRCGSSQRGSHTHCHTPRPIARSSHYHDHDANKKHDRARATRTVTRSGWSPSLCRCVYTSTHPLFTLSCFLLPTFSRFAHRGQLARADHHAHAGVLA